LRSAVGGYKRNAVASVNKRGDVKRSTVAVRKEANEPVNRRCPNQKVAPLRSIARLFSKRRCKGVYVEGGRRAARSVVLRRQYMKRVLQPCWRSAARQVIIPSMNVNQLAMLQNDTRRRRRVGFHRRATRPKIAPTA